MTWRKLWKNCPNSIGRKLLCWKNNFFNRSIRSNEVIGQSSYICYIKLTYFAALLLALTKINKFECSMQRVQSLHATKLSSHLAITRSIPPLLFLTVDLGEVMPVFSLIITIDVNAIAGHQAAIIDLEERQLNEKNQMAEHLLKESFILKRQLLMTRNAKVQCWLFECIILAFLSSLFQIEFLFLFFWLWESRNDDDGDGVDKVWLH